MELFDTHAHLDFPEYKKDLPEVLERCRENGVSYVVNVGIDIHSSQRSLQLARDYDWIYASVGIHPHDAEQLDDYSIKVLSMLAEDEKVVAFGEMGLDYYRDLAPRGKQREAFRRQISLARELNFPIIVHDREAHRDVLRILKEENAREVGGIIHCFPGDWEMARECLDNNFLIGVGGPVTFKKSSSLLDVVRRVPKDGLILETDCPFLSPEPRRGRRNEPSYLKFIAERVAELRKTDVEEVAHWTTLNALRLFKIKSG